MTNVESIGSSFSAATSSTSDVPGALSAEEFLNILISELQHQNPLEPMKNSELMSQMTQIKSLEATTQLVEKLGTLSDGMEMGSAAALMGKVVSGRAANGQTVVGKAIGLVRENGQINLIVDGYPALPVKNVEQVIDDEVADEGGEEVNGGS